MVIEVLVGMTASGKSTYARKRADQGALIVCHDDLTAMLHARYRYEPELRECYQRMEKGIAWQGLWWGRRDLVIDRTHLTKESRQRWIDTAREYNAFNDDPASGEKSVRIIAVRFPILPAEIHARRRFEHDPRGRPYEEWLKIAEHHATQAEAEPLEIAEGFDEIVDMPPEGDIQG